MSDMHNKNVYKGIDLLKLIGACLVLLLHTIETDSWYPKGVQFVFTRFAVPFFFISSGYFFYKGLDRENDKREYLIRYEKHVLTLFVIWALIINLPFTVYSYITLYKGQSWIKIFLVLFRRIFIIGSGPYWYLVALFWSAFFIYWCYMIAGDKCLVIVGGIGLIFHIAYACFQGTLSSIPLFKMIFDVTYFVFSWENNFFMFGIPFMGMGYLIAKYNIKLRMNIAISVFIIFTFLRVFEYILPSICESSFFESNRISVAFIPQGIGYFMIGKNIDMRIPIEQSRSIRQLSSFIYFSHAIFLYHILNPMLKKYTDLPVYADEMIFPKVLIVLVVCFVLFVVIKKVDNKQLNILING